MATKAELINSKEFEDALEAGAELKKNILTSYKKQNKDNYSRFYATMLDSREDIKKILETKKKSRSDADNDAVKKFKQNAVKTYSQVRDFMTPEEVEEGKQTKIEKLVDKIATVFDMLKYVESDVLDKALQKRGLVMTSQNELPSYFDSDSIKSNVKDIFDCAVKLKQKINADNDEIEDKIYAGKVPIDLQYDKKMNNSGLKPGDFRKLVDMKTKLVMANSEEAKDKVEEKIEHAASEKQFEVARAELVRDKLTKLQ